LLSSEKTALFFVNPSKYQGAKWHNYQIKSSEKFIITSFQQTGMALGRG
jgi:hypothetical protein